MLSFHTKILIDAEQLTAADKTNWEQVVVADLNQIWATHSGRAVLNNILGASKTLRIKPYYSADVNSATTPLSGKDATAKASQGTGAGSDVRIQFTPWRYPSDHLRVLSPDTRRLLTAWGIEPANMGAGQSGFHVVTILHEMVHALQMLRGQIAQKGFAYGFDEVAELDAILVENIFRSETGRYRRLNHHGRAIMWGTAMAPDVHKLKQRLDGFRNRSPELAAALERVDTPFNPLRKGAMGAPP